MDFLVVEKIMENIDWKDNKHVIIPQGTRLSERMFERNHIVETITLPDDIDSLPNFFCHDCKRLRAIYGGRNIKIVCRDTFKGCLQLHHLDFIPQIGCKTYKNRYSKEYSIEIIRELKSEDFGHCYQSNPKQFGYILHKQDKEYLIWDIIEKRFVFAVVDNNIPLYSYVSFFCKYSIYFDTTNSQLNIERNYVNDVCIESDEDAEKLIWSYDIKAYLEDGFSYIKKINIMNNIAKCYIESIDIDKIIESYIISIDEHIRYKIGGDDTYTIKETAVSAANPSDVYLAKLLPSYSKETSDSGFCTFSYMSTEEKNSYKEKENAIKAKAKKTYSDREHLSSLMDAYIKYLYRRTIIYQEVLDATIFFKKNRYWVTDFWIDFNDIPYWKDISTFVFDLNKKYRSHQEWCSYY